MLAVDDCLAERWRLQRYARERARASLPDRWLHDERPGMQQVVDVFVEALAQRSESSSRSRVE